MALERDQEDLRDSRDEYTGFRFHLQSRRTDLRKLREETASKIGSAENQLRQFLHTLSIELPQAIRDTFDEVSALRDRLGLLEVEYDESEGRYNRLEYTYTQKEARFVDQLPGSFLELGTRPQDTTVKPETEDLTRFADGALDDIHMPKAITEADLITPLTKASGSRLSDFLPTNQSVPVPERANPCQNSPNTRELSIQDDDPTPTSLDIEWMNKKERINAWLLHILSCSPLQKAHLKAMGPSVSLSDQVWWKMLKEHWNDDFLEGPAFHTGDSTISHSLIDCHADISTLETNGPESVKLENFESISPLHSTGEPPDAVDLSIAHDSVHSEMKPLSEPISHSIPAQQDADADGTQSALTNLTSTRRTFSPRDCRSVTTIPSSCRDREPIQGHLVQSMIPVCKSSIGDVPQKQDSIDDGVPITPKEQDVYEDVPPPLINTPNPSSERENQLPDIPKHPTVEEPVENLGNEYEETTTVPVSGISDDVLIPKPGRNPLLSSHRPVLPHLPYTWPLNLHRCPFSPFFPSGEFTGRRQKSCLMLKLILDNVRNPDLQEAPASAKQRYSLLSSYDELCE